MTATIHPADDAAPAPPTVWHPTDPYLVAADTWVFGPLYQAPGAPVGVHINSMLIRGREPVLVDTGPAAARELWLRDAFSLVDPDDVRWVFLTHEEPDHAGNVLEVLDRCPNATLLTSWFAVERLAAHEALPLHRMRWINDGDTVDVGDRVLHAVTPPVFDAPTTRGLFDDRTGVYWAADAFGAPVVAPATDAAELPADAWTEGFQQFARMVSPWHGLLDDDRFAAHVGRTRSLDPSVVATCHGPAVRGDQLAQAFRLLVDLPSMGAVPLPGQTDLEAILAGAGL